MCEVIRLHVTYAWCRWRVAEGYQLFFAWVLERDGSKRNNIDFWIGWIERIEKIFIVNFGIGETEEWLGESI